MSNKTSASPKTLVIAEKPSVAADIARALGGMKAVKGARGNDFFEGGDYVVSSAVGHLLELAAPESAEAKRGKWSLANLPVVPDYFDLKPIEASLNRLKVLEKLYRRRDIAAIINACDAGREGELIFHNLMRYFRGDENGKGGKQVRRLWLSSMTPAAIREGFSVLRGDEEMIPLKKAATCRNEADWLVGINATRAMTALNSSGGGFFLTTVGRVQTPTLAIIVDRENGIRSFQARPYWEVRALFAVAGGEYEGRWTDAAVKKQGERIWKKEPALAVLNVCRGGAGIVTESKKRQSESPPPLFDLTALQREANGRFGLSAKATLAAAQSLYERHKMITYPRTDSKFLPEDYPATVAKSLRALSAHSESGNHAQKIIDQKWLQTAGKRVFNNAKVSDHFAIVPTGEAEKSSLGERDLKVYRLILRRFLAVFYPPAKFEATQRTTVVGEHSFETKGRILLEAGWREAAMQTPKDAMLPPVRADEKAAVADIFLDEKETAPPPRYNEATLLSAMESAGKMVEDEELREAMKERGLGTPATRAAIIEGLLRERYLLRDGKELLPTPKAHSLLRLLKALKIEELTLPSLTGEWEHKLRRIEKAQFNHEVFMDEIRKLTGDIVGAAKDCGDVENVDGDYATLAAACPSCGGDVAESHRRFSCRGCKFFIWKAMAGREFSVPEVESLLKNKSTELLEGFRSKMGREFSAKVALRSDDEGKLRPTFEFEENKNASTEDLSPEMLRKLESVGACPKCGAPVRDNGRYICENSVGGECDFSFSRRILQQEIAPAQIKRMLDGEYSDFLDGFVSKKNNRSFRARLKIEAKTGKLTFDFSPRAAGKKT